MCKDTGCMLLAGFCSPDFTSISVINTVKQDRKFLLQPAAHKLMKFRAHSEYLTTSHDRAKILWSSILITFNQIKLRFPTTCTPVFQSINSLFLKFRLLLLVNIIFFYIMGQTALYPMNAREIQLRKPLRLIFMVSRSYKCCQEQGGTVQTEIHRPQ